MKKIITNSVIASDIAEFLGKNLVNENIVIYKPNSIDNIEDNSLVYCVEDTEIPYDNIEEKTDVLLLVKKVRKRNVSFSYILTDNPEGDFVRVINKFFTMDVSSKIDETAKIDKSCKIEENVSILKNCFIGPNVEIGKNTAIFQNVVLYGNVKIGNNCIIKANAVIGSEIFNFIKVRDKWEQFPQIGKIIIEDEVVIGANSTIERGTLKNTIIKSGVKIDDLVQVGSNCIIGKNSLLAAGSIISRDVIIGENVWIAPNVSVIDKINIGDNSIIGLGAVVIKDVLPFSTEAGNPSRIIYKSKAN